METKEEGQNEKTFKTFGKKVDQFLVELNEAGDRLQKEFQDRFEELKVAADKLKNEAGNKERWKDIETELKKAGDEFGKAFKEAFRTKD